jgi:hypothetical protein
MSDWIKVRSAEIKLAEQAKKAEWEHHVAEANALKAKVEPFWIELMKFLQDSVQEFNSEFPEAAKHIDQCEKSSSSGLLIRRTAYPSAMVKAQLTGSATSVHYTISMTQRKGADAVEKQGNFTFGLKDGEVAYIDGGVLNHEDVAKLFLEPFFQF